MSICRQALPKLIGDNVLTKAEVAALVEYVNRVEEINRGLERAGEAHATNEWLRLSFFMDSYPPVMPGAESTYTRVQISGASSDVDLDPIKNQAISPMGSDVRVRSPCCRR